MVHNRKRDKKIQEGISGVRYCMRWGLLPPTKKLRECAWKKLYMQVYLGSTYSFLVNDDRIILDKTLTDQVSIWKSSRGLTDKVVLDHDCSGETCTYYQIGDVFVCEKTGQVHVICGYLGEESI
ncbi:F-box protein SKIP31-like [Camellia sinensis]|uniref:F-box protein SKIP31-like n=1 Tax=Camellia sinensis TaxID=4442 RepID=UPI0010365309|nr:F-box protein SKIP31-like [Camellia sinensis]